MANRTYTPGKHYHIVNLDWSVDRQTHVQSNQIHYYHPRHKQCFNNDNQPTSIRRGDCIGGDSFHEGVQIVEMQWKPESRDFAMDRGYNFWGIPGPCLPQMNESKD